MSLDTDDNNSYLSVLQRASEECVRGLATLQKVAPALPLSSMFAPDVHTLLFVVGNVEVALHQFVDRELLGVRGLSDTRSQTEQTEYQKSYVCRTHVSVQTDTTDHAMPSSPNAVLSLPAGRGACGSPASAEMCQGSRGSAHQASRERRQRVEVVAVSR